MVVPLIILGTFTKLAFSVAVTHRTRAWWLPGAVAIGVGAAVASHAGMGRTLGTSSMALGAIAIVAGRWLRGRGPAR